MMIAIHTKYLSPTNSRGARIKAYTSDGRSVTIGYNYALDGVAVHHLAVIKFIQEHLRFVESNSPMCYGDSADGRGFSFCFEASKVQ
jgi:hypothetical protein